MTLLDQVIAGANTIFPDNKILRDLCIAQATLESNLFNTPSLLASKYKNLFGIKKKGTLGMVYLSTYEYIGGEKIQVKAGFGTNKTIEDSIRQYRHILDLPRYLPVRMSKTFEEAAYQIRKCGYATDIAYTSKLTEVHKRLGG